MAELPTRASVSWILLTTGIAYLLFKLLRFGRREKYLPPGPPTIPILGNAHLIPAKNIHLKFKEWSDKYGTVFSLKVGRSTIVVLNDRRAVHDLVDKRSAIYADRPVDHQLFLALRNENLALMPSGDRWRSSRKVASQMLAPQRLDAGLAAIQEAEITTLMHDLLEKPAEFRSCIKRTTGSVASIMIFGNRASSWDSFWAQLTKAVEPGSYLPVDQFPFLGLIPDRWSPARQLAKETYRIGTGTWTEARERVETRRSKGDKRDSLIDRILDEKVKFDVPLNDTQFNNLLGAVHMGASDTTATSTLTTILYLAKNPEVQEKARVELDRVCGTSRTPKWSDFDQLPYINCIVKEGLRIQPVIPPGVPHRATQDDWYNGMLIPKGATIFVSPYALHYSIYSDPSTYNPDRFLDRPKLAMVYAGSPDYENRDHYAYGAGRRICVGIHLAERMQWRIVAQLLWAFNIEPALDEKGEPIEPDTTAYDAGMVQVPLPYKMRFTPRSEKHAEVVRRELGDIEQLLKEWE
ncbi:cytochrome P450 oxidoreductase-like protein [Dothidotthia symphoricarpi CBS 119687]|uniref:Cytochrome P450 oxidoreductase-like protein n=1 Tax=Dothidotthia symphoricarpi CBS 119687 TaxID=1392245 RepID=A0A6A6A4A1_9PLEO|nr:cytochrome P450 oxidoreductase-like protein [Dothidotthia symphoricarpi CBS 119687]KAF2125588.1 cytochrome P450 oxidoreductase-like protein [Dothidotthia symphoricarpi CBS 119687]